ncbi:MAG TPA: ferritin-like domain-containing protein [Gemmatimonadaceae bacterium]|nr:ferritin-like domain-containing protein [Gemmatimonadaceae bacterium]
MLHTMRDLLVENLRDLYSAENQLTKALPRIARAVKSENLAEAIEDHLNETEEHVNRLREIFELLGERPTGKRCRGMEGLLDEGEEVINEDGGDAILDAAIISAAQKVEHYEIAAYGSAVAYAEMLDMNDVAEILEETLEEEKAADERLTELAENEISPQAELEGGIAGDEEEAEGDEDQDQEEWETESEAEMAEGSS